MRDGIFALATAPGRAAVAVVRLSGSHVGEALINLAGALPAPRLATLRRLKDADGATIDQALVLWFEGPASYTGEDSAELHLHGGRAVVERVMLRLGELGLRLAEPGEFTRRAFENGKLDLAQAEAVADLVDAETALQAKQALDQLGGALSRRYESWRESLLEALALLEAAVDFPDEDLPEDVAARAHPAMTMLLGELREALADAERGRRVRDGYRIALIGAPNAGKSSLLNALVERDAAIVTAIPGTTRDVVEVPLVLGGYKVLLADTAGVRKTSDEVESEGVRRARRWAEEADLRLWVVDSHGADSAWREARDLVRSTDLLLMNKSDLPGQALELEFEGERIACSTWNSADMDHLRGRLTDRVVDALSGADFPAATRLRHLDSLAEARDALTRALSTKPELIEVMAEEVRLAARALARVTGRIDPEAVLGKVFSSFCIGK
ncbi:tRNA uridine-5-carboxymethylaminomethyl(34) synthesis GTPase MnmE [Caulobacter segnis]|uniref:tRNA uridine-5-carboxymethylaminomethyl(34) synthesis GTPase MnmE n=1 Tax=Caulobacter segnis TaxID=88688 RepID=UPI0024105AD5|nr:tRNA uridine-5-carboxymethylaminomethyl(34) synthesis GTPase MnmE [Caulobacter segnis]MDG2521536.1 tRNA uridine-5-carboxymethylaminomethyl(34) synthesis GTPase MnmE [Caulobacter segnis]